MVTPQSQIPSSPIREEDIEDGIPRTPNLTIR